MVTNSVNRADVHVCLDACFTQKRRQSTCDPVYIHPESVFLPETVIKDMEDAVAARRPPRPKATPQDTLDGFEAGMRIPLSVLRECTESFTAADEKRQKANTQFFSDTGIMALLCRHDRVLWLANMTSAGEKQHYALALLQTLFQNLPASTTVGALYDIGCNLHHSCIKWGFLGEYLDRLTFAVSVFHAFGHQWPCQLIYHPRKCSGFGMTDGEGCERLWSAIKNLIPVLRVSGVSEHLIFSRLA